MFGQFYRGMPWTDLPIFALLLFIGVFAAVVVRSCLARREEIDRMGRIPLDDGQMTRSETKGGSP